MPFTLAHPAAALPLVGRLGRHGVPSALVIGAMAPDLRLFLPLPFSFDFSHSILGMFVFCLPMTLAIYAIWHLVFKEPAIALLPDVVTRRIPRSARSGLPAAGLQAVVVSALVGTMTHLFWDAFTHEDTLLVSLVGVLRMEILTIDSMHYQVYDALQVISSVVGMALIALWTLRWYLRAKPVHPPLAGAPPEYLRGCLVTGGAGLTVYAAYKISKHGHYIHDAYTAHRFVVKLLVNGMMLAALAFTLVAIAWHVVAWTRRGRGI